MQWRPPPEAYAWMEKLGCPRMPPRELLESKTPFPWPRDEYIHVIWPGRCCLHALIGHSLRSPDDERWLDFEWRPTKDLVVEAVLSDLQKIVKANMFWSNYARKPVNTFLTSFATGLADIVVSACRFGDNAEHLHTALSIHLRMTGDTNPHLARIAEESACTWFLRLARQILGPPPASVERVIKAKCGL